MNADFGISPGGTNLPYYSEVSDYKTIKESSSLSTEVLKENLVSDRQTRTEQAALWQFEEYAKISSPPQPLQGWFQVASSTPFYSKIVAARNRAVTENNERMRLEERFQEAREKMSQEVFIAKCLNNIKHNFHALIAKLKQPHTDS
jgi:hypothetical protein